MFQIIWTDEAILQQVAILEFWIEHNQSTNYSEKILQEVMEYELLLEVNPYIGHLTDYKKVRRVIILNNFSLFYKIIDDTVSILGIRDNRRNPKNIAL